MALQIKACNYEPFISAEQLCVCLLRFFISRYLLFFICCSIQFFSLNKFEGVGDRTINGFGNCYSGAVMILAASWEFDRSHNADVQERPSDNEELPPV